MNPTDQENSIILIFKRNFNKSNILKFQKEPMESQNMLLEIGTRGITKIPQIKLSHSQVLWRIMWLRSNLTTRQRLQ